MAQAKKKAKQQHDIMKVVAALKDDPHVVMYNLLYLWVKFDNQKSADEFAAANPRWDVEVGTSSGKDKLLDE